jgi:hypothetical protein
MEMAGNKASDKTEEEEDQFVGPFVGLAVELS